MYRYIVASNKPLSPTTQLLTLKPSDSLRYPLGYYPGQYAAIAFKRGPRVTPARCFSLTSSPHDGTYIQFSIRVGGRFTHMVQTAKPGQEVYVRGPYGGFVVNHEVHKDLVFIAGGIGIAPFMSMLRFAAATHDQTPMVLLYGLQSKDDIPFHAELQRIKAELPNLRVVYAISHGEANHIVGQEVVAGRIDDAVLRSQVGTEVTGKTVFICGPPPFMNALVRSCKTLGIPKSHIITEAFKQGNHRQTGKVVSWPRNMYVFGALGIAVGTLGLLVTDIVRKLPSTPLKKESEARYQLHGDKTLRDAELDALINSYAAKVEAGKTVSPATSSALNDAKIPETILVAADAVPTTPKSTSTTYVAPQPTTTSAPTATNPTQTAPTPKCTTTQSGVTTCV